MRRSQGRFLGASRQSSAALWRGSGLAAALFPALQRVFADAEEFAWWYSDGARAARPQVPSRPLFGANREHAGTPCCRGKPADL